MGVSSRLGVSVARGWVASSFIGARSSEILGHPSNESAYQERSKTLANSGAASSSHGRASWNQAMPSVVWQ